MSEDDFAWAKQTSDEYLKIRHYFTMDFYNHGSSVYDDTAWAIWQYHDDEKNCGIVMAFRRGHSPFDYAAVDLKGLTGHGDYVYSRYDDGNFDVTGSHLRIYLPHKRSSTIIEYMTSGCYDHNT